MTSKRKKAGIYRKIMHAFLAVILLLAVGGSAVVWIYLTTAYKTQVLKLAEDELQGAADTVSNVVEEIFHVSYAIQYSDAIGSVLKDTSEKDIEEQYEDMWKMDDALNSLILPFSMAPVSIYVDDQAVYAGNNLNYRKKEELEQYQEYDVLRSSSKPFIWLSKESTYDSPFQNKEYVSFLRKIGQINNPAGYMRINMDVDQLSGMLKDLHLFSGETGFLYNIENMELIACTETEGSLDLAERLCSEKVSENGLLPGEWDNVRLGNGSSFFVLASTVPGTPWMAVCMIPRQALQIHILRMLVIWILVLVAVALVALGLASRISGNITQRIELLEHNMGNLSVGSFEEMTEDAQEDEISDLIRHYNKAIRQMVDLHQQRYDAMKELKSAQLTILQSQINPHFLYNTLDMIHWEAMDSGAERIVEIVRSLASFYRLSLNGGKEMVSIRDEINHVLSYLEIIDYKYPDKIQYDVEIPLEMYEEKIPRITLQPLVENAIFHGLLEKKTDEDLEIEIYGWREEEYLYLQISDNGIGMTQQEMEDLLTAKADGKSEAGGAHGYGVGNINERLVLLYGETCGLTFSGGPGEGTTVLITIMDHLKEEMREEWQ